MYCQLLCMKRIICDQCQVASEWGLYMSFAQKSVQQMEPRTRQKVENQKWTFTQIVWQHTSIYIYNTNRNPRWERWVFARFVFSLFFHSQLSKCPKTQGKPKKTKKTILWEESWVSPCKIVFFFFLVFLEVFFTLPSPIVQKLEENQKKQKNQSCEKNLG